MLFITFGERPYLNLHFLGLLPLLNPPIELILLESTG
jgi:hypothetical protein